MRAAAPDVADDLEGHRGTFALTLLRAVVGRASAPELNAARLAVAGTLAEPAPCWPASRSDC